ncbi:MAG TPA: GTPase [archaeon]|nr:GTPase [archaeon]
MQKGFMGRVSRIIEKSDLLLEVLDARFPELTRNSVTETKILRSGKKLILVLNKSDLASKETLLKEKKSLEKFAPCVFLSTKERSGIRRLRETIGKTASTNRQIVIGVLGYPNTGKSSIINSLRGRAVARVSPKAGFTRGEQFVRISQKILLVDSPGIIPFEQKNEFELMLVSSKNAEQLKQPEEVALELIDWILLKNPEAIKENFGIEETESEEILEKFALKKNKLLKQGLPDTKTASKLLIQEWQKAKIKI